MGAPVAKVLVDDLEAGGPEQLAQGQRRGHTSSELRSTRREELGRKCKGSGWKKVVGTRREVIGRRYEVESAKCEVPGRMY